MVEPTTVDANAREVGVRVTAGAVPVPVRVTACGDPVALSAIESDAFNAPAAAGLNSTETVQEAAAASVVPQVVADLMNEVALVPVMVSTPFRDAVTGGCRGEDTSKGRVAHNLLEIRATLQTRLKAWKGSRSSALASSLYQSSFKHVGGFTMRHSPGASSSAGR